MRFYYIELIGTAVFAITGVLVVTRRGLDVSGALVLGLMTAVAGGTLRDLLIRVPIFWINDFNYVWAALAGALAAFWIGSAVRNTYRVLLYLDALGAALFAIAAANKVLLQNIHPPVAVIMGVLTALAGGLLRDVLAGRPTLLMSREVYATPVLVGCTLFITLRQFAPPFPDAGALAIAVIFGIRAYAIHRRLEVPGWLTLP